ncbi:MAG: HlyD family type I secretion periplasmic adaptor subunit [Pararhodobacter sp.]
MTLPADQRAAPALLLGVISSLVLVAGLGLWAAWVPLDGAVLAHGEVDMLSAAHPVQHAEGGVVSEVAVAEGQSVAAGDLLLRLDGSADAPEWALIEGQMADLTARIARLEAERSGAPFGPPPDDADSALRAAWQDQTGIFLARAAILARQADQLAQRRIQAEAELSGLAAQARALQAETDLVEVDLAREETLISRGLAPETGRISIARDMARLQGALAAIDARAAELRGLISEVALQAETLVASFRAEAEAERQRATAQRLELAARQAQLAERRARRSIRAPVAGRVHALAVTAPGIVLAPGATALILVPEDLEPTIRLRLGIDDIDRVSVGQAASLHFPALAPQGITEIGAQILNIAPAALTDESRGVRYFPVSVGLTDAGRAALGGRSLVPGMAVLGFIATGERTPFDYLIAPIRDQMARALREP